MDKLSYFFTLFIIYIIMFITVIIMYETDKTFWDGVVSTVVTGAMGVLGFFIFDFCITKDASGMIVGFIIAETIGALNCNKKDK